MLKQGPFIHTIFSWNVGTKMSKYISFSEKKMYAEWRINAYETQMYNWILMLYVPCMMRTSIYQTNLQALKCEYNKYINSYMFRHFLSAIVSFDLFRNEAQSLAHTFTQQYTLKFD
jgi:hypothetical protein